MILAFCWKNTHWNEHPVYVRIFSVLTVQFCEKIHFAVRMKIMYEKEHSFSYCFFKITSCALASDFSNYHCHRILVPSSPHGALQKWNRKVTTKTRLLVELMWKSVEMCGNDIKCYSLIKLCTFICLNSTLKAYFFKNQLILQLQLKFLAKVFY